MNPALTSLFLLLTVLLVGCDHTVPLVYETRSEATADKPFARGWLPEIIPSSSRAISMSNDLDLNISNGEFEFDALDHDGFVSQMKRLFPKDRDHFTAYSFEEWTFWIAPNKSHCRYRMVLNTDQEPSDHGTAGQLSRP